MSDAELKKLAKIPRYLIPGRGKPGAPGVIKKYVARICYAINDEWRLFSEGCLRNRYFRSQVLQRGPDCMACSRKLDERSKIDQHHNDYLWSCIGPLLPEGSQDVHRAPQEDEYPDIPDCRTCHTVNPEHFAECLRRIYPVHHKCHGRIHEKERYFKKQAQHELLDQFNGAAAV